MEQEEKETKKPQGILPQRIINIKFKPNYSGNYAEDKPKFLKLFKEKGAEVDLPIVEKALDLVYDLFKEDRRGDGTMFYTHFLETAHILLTKFKISDTDTIVSALLHDSVEDKKEKITLDDLELLFNSKVAEIVNGVTKITDTSDLEKTLDVKLDREFEYESQELATIQKVFTYGLKNPKIFLVKFADRFHNILTLYGIKNPNRRKEIANQTINIFVPLIKVFGYEEVAKELRDLCLFHTIAEDPDTAEKIYSKLRFIHSQLQERFLRIARKYDLEENLFKIANSISSEFTLTVAHKTLSELWQAVAGIKNDIKSEPPSYYQHYYWVINIPSNAGDIKDKITKLDKKLKSTFPVLGEDIPLIMEQEPPTEIIQDVELGYRKFFLSNFESFEVMYNLMPADVKIIDLEKVILQSSVYRKFEDKEYSAFIELIEYLYKQNVPNKMQMLIEYAKKIYPSSYITVEDNISRTRYFVPRGFTVLDLVFKISPQKASNALGARIINQQSSTPISKGLNYVLQDGDFFELIFASRPTYDFGNVKPFSLVAINELRKIKEKLKELQTKDKEFSLLKKIFIKGVDKFGLGSEITGLASSLQINFTLILMGLPLGTKDTFSGNLYCIFYTFEQMNAFVLELMKVPEIKEVMVLEVTPEEKAQIEKTLNYNLMKA